ncbi:MAG: spermidine/putrescine ABC transporter substrate-binding protein [Clostridia bacterium]|nr:spermidine/putrescine ABC transporter substrate-binding protein [Clostridia bacterium]
MKKIFCVLLAVSVILFAFTGCGEAEEEVITLNVFNWGEYISDGDGSWEYEDEDGNVIEIPYLDINAEFEKYYAEKYPNKKVEVNYTTYASNEELYAKMTTSDASYDIIIPSEYLITKLIRENLIQPINIDNIPNYANIGEAYQAEGVSYVTENGEKTYYSATYTFCKVGIIYNKTLLEETFEDFSQEEFEAEGWGVLWNEKYKDLGILQFNNSRDAFATAQFMMMGEDNYEGAISYINASVLDEGGKEIYDRALEKLKEQQPLIQKYVMDEVFNKMETGNAAIAPYYAGDYFTMTWNCEDYELCLFYPEVGSNSFLDAMCIPTSAKHPEIAEEYINFMLSVSDDPTENISAINSEYICYGSPNMLVQQDEYYKYFVENEMHEEAYDILYGEDVFRFQKEGFACLDEATQNYLNECWDSLKIQDSEESNALPIICGVLASVIAFILIYNAIEKKRRARYWD